MATSLPIIYGRSTARTPEEQSQSQVAPGVTQGHKKATADPSFVGMTAQWEVRGTLNRLVSSGQILRRRLRMTRHRWCRIREGSIESQGADVCNHGIQILGRKAMAETGFLHFHWRHNARAVQNDLLDLRVRLALHFM